MSIVSLLCKIDDFFLEYEAYVSIHCLPSETGSETRGCPNFGTSNPENHRGTQHRQCTGRDGRGYTTKDGTAGVNRRQQRLW